LQIIEEGIQGSDDEIDGQSEALDSAESNPDDTTEDFSGDFFGNDYKSTDFPGWDDQNSESADSEDDEDIELIER
jgi:hypothetical protein